MSNLIIKNENGKFVVDSRQVAEMVERPHNDLMKSIRNYCEHLTKGDFPRSDFFIEDAYQDSTGRTLPQYLITRKGCDMVANKMTGEKGVLFTAAYVTKFEEMENQLKPTCLEDVMIQSLQEMKAMKQQVAEARQGTQEVKQELQDMRDVITLDTTSWRTETTKVINSIARSLGGNEHIRNVRTEAYQLLDKRFGVSLETRLTNKRRRMADEGICKSKRDKLNQLDVIADDKKLIEGFVAIIKQMAVKYGVSEKISA